MAELTQSLCLYLTDTLTCDIELPSDLLEGPCLSVVQTEPEPQNLLLPFGKSIKDLVQLLLQKLEGGSISRHRTSRTIRQTSDLFMAIPSKPFPSVPRVYRFIR